MKRCWVCGIVLGSLWAGGCQQAAMHLATRTTETGAADAAALGPAIEQLSAETEDERTAAIFQVAEAIDRNAAEAGYVTQIVLLIQRGIAEQTRMLATVEDPEARLRLSQVMQFNESLSRFAMDMLELPAEQRRKMLAWGFDPQHVDAVNLAYAADSDRRVEGARALAQFKGPEADTLLAVLVDDYERDASLAAMDVMGDRPASDILVDALWRKAVEYPMMQFGQNYGLGLMEQNAISRTSGSPKTLNIHGRMVQIYDYERGTMQYSRRVMDGDVACEILVGWKAPRVEEKLVALFAMLAEPRNDPNKMRWRILSPDYGYTGVNLRRMVEAYRPKAAVPYLIARLSTGAGDGYNQMINNQMYRYSARVDALALLVKVTDQNAEDYKLVNMPMWGGRWLMAGDEKQEEAAAKKMKEWWGVHFKEYGATDAKVPDVGGGGSFGRGMRLQRD